MNVEFCQSYESPVVKGGVGEDEWDEKFGTQRLKDVFKKNTAILSHSA